LSRVKANTKDYFVSIFYSEEDDGYTADMTDLCFFSAFGKTPQKALQEVQNARFLARIG
jgi:predicted RNase H-like HicB family nuclease